MGVSFKIGEAYIEPETHGELTNHRCYSYGYVHEMAKEVGLSKLIEGYWMRPHAGIKMIENSDIEQIELALLRPGLSKEIVNELEWFRYWLKWSKRNCSVPSIKNT